MKIINVVGTRPNFMKIAPIIKAMDKESSIEHLLLHTGQHYDLKLSKNFFDELGIPHPDINLNIGSDTQTKQVARIMTAFEAVCDEHQPDMILVVGDVNSTMACSLVAAKKGIKIIHVEAGIRSNDRSMPEEINRLVTDSLADYLLPPSTDAVDNLLKEGHDTSKIHLVGNVMIDTLKMFEDKVNGSTILEKLNVSSNEYVALTLHRPSNVDDVSSFQKILNALKEIQKQITVVFPIHPRTQKMIKELGLDHTINEMENILIVEPMGYLDFGKLISNARFVLTDSGGIQEETTVYGVPCITLRENTERPVTVSQGTNELAGMNTEKIIKYAKQVLEGHWKSGKIPEYWDGKAAKRIVSYITKIEG